MTADTSLADLRLPTGASVRARPGRRWPRRTADRAGRPRLPVLVAFAALSALAGLAACGRDGPGAVDEDPTVAAGRALTEQRNCLSCHSTNGARLAGPTWKGLAGSTVELTDGRSLAADRAYLRRAILEPNAEVVAGFAPGLMSSNIRGGPITEAEADAIVAYLESLG